MARIEIWTRNGDALVVTEHDPAKIARLEKAQFDDTTNVDRTRVTED